MKKKPMKRNTKIIIILIAGFLIAVFFYKNAFKSLGVIRESTSEVKSGTSQFTFDGKQGMEIKLYYSPDIKEGSVVISLIDANGNKIEELTENESKLVHVTLSNDCEYTVLAEYTDLKGNFKIRAEK